MEINRYKVGQRIKTIKDYCLGIGTIKSVEIKDINKFVYCVCFDDSPADRKIEGGLYLWFYQVDNEEIFEVIEDVKEEVEQLQTKEIKHTKISDEEIALELVKSWGSQSGNPAKFNSFINNYFEALKQIKGGRYETNRKTETT